MAVLRPILASGLRVLFVGINPSLRSEAVGHHFARPGNRFWPTLHAAGFTPRRMLPEEDRAADELSRGELRGGARQLEHTISEYRPLLVAVVGITAYRTAFDRPRAGLGLQAEEVGGRPVWVLANPSGLNAHYKPADFVRLYAEARAYAESLS